MANTEKNETYVTALAGPDDRWLSVTDAARITRRQEKSIRDWVESGKLPVHPERVGLNKRTRQVRLSDLAKLTPLVDPEAGISTDVGLLDLPSIPKAQQRLTEQMTALQQEVGEQFARLTAQLGTLVTHQEQQRRGLLETLQSQADLQAGLLRQAQEEMAHGLQHARTASADLVAQSDQALRLWVAEQVGQSEARFRQDVTVLFARLAEVEQALRKELAGAVQELHSVVADQDARQIAALSELDTRISATLQEHQMAHEQLQAQSDERYSETHRQLIQLAMSATTLEEHLGGQETRTSLLEASMSQLETTWQQRAVVAEKDARQLHLDLDSQVKTQQALQKQLDEERKAREALAKQVERLFQQGKRGKV